MQKHNSNGINLVEQKKKEISNVKKKKTQAFKLDIIWLPLLK